MTKQYCELNLVQPTTWRRENRLRMPGLGRILHAVLVYAALMVFTVYAVGPILWTILSSFQNRVDILSTPPVLIFQPTLDNYRKLLETFPDFGHYVVNSVVTSIISTAIVIILAVLAAYGVTRFRFWWRSGFLLGVMVHRMIPEVSLAIPFFLLARTMGLYDSLLAIILAMVAFMAPFAVWMLLGFVEKVPVEVEESAQVDGCTRLEAFWHITIPLMLPGIAVTFIFCFIFAWNLFLLPLILTSSKAMTLAPLVAKLSTEFGIEWGPMTALATILYVPLLILGASIQRYLVSGLTMGAIKG
jgi:multiple sugar transport system permease protein